jgi:hypothetical protein
MTYIFANNDHAYIEYEQKIQTLFNRNQLNFLSPMYNVGIFTVEKDFGYAYCNQLLKEFPECRNIIIQNIERYIRFIRIGEQEQFLFKELNLAITANTARYIYHAFLISKYIREKFGHQPLDIVEIGGGYGGLCFWLYVLNPEQINQYTIIDLPVANQLQQRCLSELGVTAKTVSEPHHIQKGKAPLFVISNYGYSEFNEYFQKLYRDTVLAIADGGFMIWNNWTGIFTFTSLPMRVEDETPYFPNVYNKFIYF